MKNKTKTVIGADESGLFCITKKLFTILLLCLACNFGYSQTVTTTDGKTYTAVSKPKQTAKPVETGKIYITSKGEKFPIYQSEGGSYFVIRVSQKSGKPYKQYLKL